MRALLPPSLLMLHTFLTIATSSFLHNVHVVEARQADPLPVPENPIITTLINSSNGTDITSSFQTFLYIPDDDKEIAQLNLTGRSLAPRQGARTAQFINRCRRQPSLFQYSQCNHVPERLDAMRRWNATCKFPPYTAGSGTFTETGTCRKHEICVNGHRSADGNPTVAACVGTQSFVEYVPKVAFNAGRQRYLKNLVKRMTGVSVTFSQTDGRTPLEVEMIALSAGVAGVEKAGEEEVSETDRESCQNCVDLNTGTLDHGTDALKMQATVAVGVGATTAGILWLAALSG